jgi:hypothetical protein
MPRPIKPISIFLRSTRGYLTFIIVAFTGTAKKNIFRKRYPARLFLVPFAFGFLCLTPDPSPAYFIRQTGGFLAGEGRLNREGAESPLSQLTPPLKHVKKRVI